MVLLSPNILIEALIVMMGSVTPGYNKKKLTAVSIKPSRGIPFACFQVEAANCQGLMSKFSI
jgi:hypothetical protein